MTKRKFLTLLAGSIGGIVTVVTLGSRRRLYEFVASLRPTLPDDGRTGTLTARQMENLVALGEVLVDGRDLSSEEKDYLRSHITERTENDPGYFSLYGQAADFLEGTSREVFAQLPREARDSIAHREQLTLYPVRRREWIVPWRRKARVIRHLAVPDLITAYYRSPAGWAVVKYQHFPGSCGDLARYTRAEVQVN